MRGLTKLEREVLSGRGIVEPDDPLYQLLLEASRQLVRDGRATFHDSRGFWDFRITPLGEMALRVCPP